MKTGQPTFRPKKGLKYFIALCAGTASLSSPFSALAQQAPLAEEMVVTGSRLQRDPNATAPQPIQVIDSETIGNTAVTDIADILTENPALMSSSIGSASNDNTSNTSRAGNIGGSALNLRSLGSERTLTLVNGRRHVSGIEGTSAVDVGTIPSGLIERVEVLTGGASAVYGADAVTGVVNFVLKDDFEGTEFTARTGMSGRGDGETFGFEGLFGKNFGNGRGNITVAIQYDKFSGLRDDERSWTRNMGTHTSSVNPLLRFQEGDIDAASMPNLSDYYDYDAATGRFPWGSTIPSVEAFSSNYADQFGSAPTLTQAEQELLNRTLTAKPLTLAQQETYHITSPYGVTGYGAVTTGVEGDLANTPDFDGNGTPDCLQSFNGYNSPNFGGGGCWYMTADGQLMPYQDGLVVSGSQSIAAQPSLRGVVSPSIIMPKDEKYSINVTTNYDLTPSMQLFGEFKFVQDDVATGGGVDLSTDNLYSAADNPYIPAELQAYANQPSDWFGPGLYTSRDFENFGTHEENDRKTYRFVGGLNGSFDEWGMDYEISANYGAFERESTNYNTVIIDRFFASLDAVTDPGTGEVVCRSDLDPAAYPATSPWNFPRYLGNQALSPFFTFSPGDGQCQPLNIFDGSNISQAALDFFTYDRPVEEKIEQTVIGGFLSGTSDPWFSLPAGPVSFAVGFEWREESSRQNWHVYDQGIIQVAGVTPDGQNFSPGDWVGDVSDAASLGNQPATRLSNAQGEYDTTDYYVELEVPVLAGLPFAEEVTVNASARNADYSTFGSNTTWGAGLVWVPVEDIRIRATHSEAIRVPNIYELFSPRQGATFRPNDPCSEENIPSAVNPSLRQSNCIAALRSYNVPENLIFDGSGAYNYSDPLTASFAGETGGNDNLLPEEATTKTVGVVLQPHFIPGFTFSADLWDIEIEGAIESISAQRIVDSCYDAPSLNNTFCANLSRISDSTSPQVGGFNYLLQGLMNFGAVQARGLDLTAAYRFEVGAWLFGVNATATNLKQHDLIQPAEPGEPAVVDEELGELNKPEWAGQLSLSASIGDLSMNWRTQYQGEQVMTGEIETADQNYGNIVWSDDFFAHNVSARYEYSDVMSFFGGIGNVTDEQPFITSNSTPVTSMGRSYYIGVDYTF